VYQEEGEWNANNEGCVNIKLLCHRCYESLRARFNPAVPTLMAGKRGYQTSGPWPSSPVGTCPVTHISPTTALQRPVDVLDVSSQVASPRWSMLWPKNESGRNRARLKLILGCDPPRISRGFWLGCITVSLMLSMVARQGAASEDGPLSRSYVATDAESNQLVWRTSAPRSNRSKLST
jgi:hypothetical protein